MYVHFYDSTILYKVNTTNIMHYAILLYYISESASNSQKGYYRLKCIKKNLSLLYVFTLLKRNDHNVVKIVFIDKNQSKINYKQ